MGPPLGPAGGPSPHALRLIACLRASAPLVPREIRSSAGRLRGRPGRPAAPGDRLEHQARPSLVLAPVRTAARPLSPQVGQAPLPAVFTAPIRADIVSMVHTNMAKNHRQPYAVSTKAGHQTSAESWGTGRCDAHWGARRAPASRMTYRPPVGCHCAARARLGDAREGDARVCTAALRLARREGPGILAGRGAFLH